MKNKKVIIISLIVFVLVVILLLVVLTKEKEDNEEGNEDTIVFVGLEDYKGLMKDENEYENTFDIYLDSKNEEVCTSSIKEDCGKLISTIKTKTNKVEILDYYKDKYILYIDNYIKLYNISNNNIYIVNINNHYSNYKLCVDNINNIVKGIIYTVNDNEYSNYYSIIKDKDMYTNKYKDLVYLNTNYMFGREITKDSEKVSLLNTDKEETLLSETNDKPNEYNLFYDYIVNGNHKYIGFGYQYLYESVYSKLYDLKLNVIYNVDKRSSYNINSNEYYNGNISFSENGNFYEYYDGKFNEYDPNGKKLKSINIDGEVKMVIDKYAVVINNTSLVLKTMDKTITIDKWDDDRVFHNDLSYYDKGVHLVVGYNESLINYYYNPSTGKVTF